MGRENYYENGGVKVSNKIRNIKIMYCNFYFFYLILYILIIVFCKF